MTFASAAFAQTYIVPDGNCGAITLHATRGTDFPNLGETIGVDRVKDAHLYLPEQKVAVKPAAGPRSLDFSTNVPDNGLVIAAVDFEPTVSGNETRTEHAKAVIRCGGISRDSWRGATGLGLEVYPQWNEGFPLKPGHSMRFIAVDKATNKLIRDVVMDLYRAGADHVGSGVPDQYGIMNFPDKERSRYMVNGDVSPSRSTTAGALARRHEHANVRNQVTRRKCAQRKAIDRIHPFGRVSGMRTSFPSRRQIIALMNQRLWRSASHPSRSSVRSRSGTTSGRIRTRVAP